MPRTRRQMVEDKIRCFLCEEMTAKKKMADWELRWLQRCSESLSQLLDVECFSSSFFEAETYCQICIDRLRDVDFTLRSATSLQSRLFELRSQIAQFLLSRIDNADVNEVAATPDSVSNCLSIHGLCSVTVANNPQDAIDQPLEPDTKGLNSQEENHDLKVFDEIMEDSGEHDTVENDIGSGMDNITNTENEESVPVRTSARRSIGRVIYCEDDDSSNDFSDGRAEYDDEYIPEGVNCSTEKQPYNVPSKLRRRKRQATSLRPATLNVKVKVGSDSPLSFSRTPKRKKPNSDKLSEKDFLAKFKCSGYWTKTDEELESSIREFAQTLISADTLMANVNEDRNDTQLDLIVFLLRTELEENYKSTNTFICTFPSCPARFSKIPHLRSHKAKEHGEYLDVEPFECPFCNIRCVTEPFLNCHIRRTHEKDEKPHHCEVSGCFKTFRKSTLLIRHIRLRHREMESEVGEMRKTYFEYRDRVAMSTKSYYHKKPKSTQCKIPRMFFCPEESCPFSTATEQNLLFHRLEIHEKRPRPFPCSICGKEFKARKAYSKHPCVIKEGIRHQCEHCGRTFNSQFKITLHKKMRHKDAVEFRCSVCDRCYFRPEEVERHEKLHTPEVGFNCVLAQCSDPYFETQEALRQHVGGPSHDMTQKTRCCDICGYVASGLRAAGLLKQHMLIHTGEARHKCRFCDKRLKTRATLKQHEEVNHQDLIEKRVYACKLCDATFTVAQYLFKHNAWHKYGSNACRPIAKKK